MIRGYEVSVDAANFLPPVQNDGTIFADKRHGEFEAMIYGDATRYFPELVGLSQRGLSNLAEATDAIEPYIINREDLRSEQGEETSRDQEYAAVVAKTFLGVEAVVSADGGDFPRICDDILAGRVLKYIVPMEERRAAGRADELSVADIKLECRERWGKGQFRFTDDQYRTLTDMRDSYRAALEQGLPQEEAMAFATSAHQEDAYLTSFTTFAGEERELDLRRFIGFKPGFVALVKMSGEFERDMGQGADLSFAQVNAEMAEVEELIDFLDPDFTEHPGSELKLRFGTIEEFRSHIEMLHADGQLPKELHSAYLGLESISDVEAYIRKNLLSEYIDCCVAATGIVARTSADVDLAKATAIGERDLTYGVGGLLIRDIAEQLLGGEAIELTPSVVKQLSIGAGVDAGEEILDLDALRMRLLGPVIDLIATGAFFTSQ